VLLGCCVRRSHIWGTGQDQCANIKRQLCLLLPGVSVFLDVDDLQDIGELETCDCSPFKSGLYGAFKELIG
jgi:hypothetical protein